MTIFFFFNQFFFYLSIISSSSFFCLHFFLLLTTIMVNYIQGAYCIIFCNQKISHEAQANDEMNSTFWDDCVLYKAISLVITVISPLQTYLLFLNLFPKRNHSFYFLGYVCYFCLLKFIELDDKGEKLPQEWLYRRKKRLHSNLNFLQECLKISNTKQLLQIQKTTI